MKNETSSNVSIKSFTEFYTANLKENHNVQPVQNKTSADMCDSWRFINIIRCNELSTTPLFKTGLQAWYGHSELMLNVELFFWRATAGKSPRILSFTDVCSVT